MLQVLQRLYPAVGADGMVLFQAAKIRDPKKNAAFLQLMRTAGESNNVPELKAWALRVGHDCNRCRKWVNKLCLCCSNQITSACLWCCQLPLLFRLFHLGCIMMICMSIQN